MCLIVDANLCTSLLAEKPSDSYQKLHDEIFRPKAKIKLIHGGKLTQEYQSTHKAWSRIVTLSQSGRAVKISDQAIEAELKIIKDQCESNDAHVIALARADRKHGRVLCTKDEALKKDFKNKKLIDRPRGVVYSPKQHKQCLSHC